jgi:glycerol-3-phosphate dehydrogenase
MDDKENSEIVAPSAGVHIILPNYYSPGNMGLLDPATSDGRVIFFLPWQGNTIAGTTGKILFVNIRIQINQCDLICLYCYRFSYRGHTKPTSQRRRNPMDFE